MAKLPQEVAGFAAFPITFPATKACPVKAKHYIYIKPHDPKIPDKDAARSLFLANIPVTTSELHLKHLFATQLSAGRVESVAFSDDQPSTKQPQTDTTSEKASKKRKRPTSDQLTHTLAIHALLPIWPTASSLHPSGAHAVVTFLDRPSMELSLRAVKKATKHHSEIIWGDGLPEDQTTPQGLARYTLHNQLRYPSRRELLTSVDEYMSAYAALEEARQRESAKKVQEVDEDGFVTVTRGAVRRQEADAVAERAVEKAEKKKIGEGFYRFQMRERAKERKDELVRRFEEDRRVVEGMRKKRRGVGGGEVT